MEGSILYTRATVTSDELSAISLASGSFSVFHDTPDGAEVWIERWVMLCSFTAEGPADNVNLCSSFSF